MSFQQTPSRDAPCLAVRWPACDAETVHVTFARSAWETPGIELERQPDGEFMCIIGETDPFEELLFKFIIDGTKWEVNRSIPVILDEHGYENNRWTPSEAAAYHDFCVLRLRRRITLGKVDKVELCRLALSIHGKTDKDGRQLECVIDETAPDFSNEASPGFLMSEVFNEIVFLRFQPLGGQFGAEGQGGQLWLANNGETNDSKEDEVTNEAESFGDLNKQGSFAVNSQDKDKYENDVWMAKFPADPFPHWLDSCRSNPEKERRMESECSTMRFLNEHTKIPAPQVYAYDVRYIPLPGPIPETMADKFDPDRTTSNTENKVRWPFILMEKPGALPFLPYWLFMGEPHGNVPNLPNGNQVREKILEQMVGFQMELAQHPLTACGYLTLNRPRWQIRNEKSTRKNSAPKSAFGIRPCIYDTCMPFANSIVSAFGSIGGISLFPPARASNSLNSVTARFQHFLTHGAVNSKNHFIALWQLRAMIHGVFGARYENGPFMLQHPDLFPKNILVTENEDGSLAVSCITGWGDTQVVPVQIAACPPRMCLGRLRYSDDSKPLQCDNLFQASVFSEKALSRHRHEYGNSMVAFEDHIVKAGYEPAIWEGFGGVKIYLSEVLREEMVLPVYVLDELCSGSMYKLLTEDVIVKYFPLVYKMVKGHEWEDVKLAVLSKGAMQIALQDWEKRQGKKVVNDLVAEAK